MIVLYYYLVLSSLKFVLSGMLLISNLKYLLLSSYQNCKQTTQILNSMVYGGKMGTPGVKWVQLFLKYLHPWSPVFMRDSLIDSKKTFL